MNLPVVFIAGMAMAFDSSSAQSLRLHRLFSDEMVLQRDQPIPVHGEGPPGATITVRMGGSSATTAVSAEGRWTATLPSTPAGGPHVLEVTTGDERIHLGNILTGDVWLASGQSNMAWKIGEGVINKEQEIANANHPRVRFFNVPERLSANPKDDLLGARWERCFPATVAGFSAAAYFFAREVSKETGVPIGIITSARGGTRVESWMSQTALQPFPNDKKEWVESLNRKYGGWENGIEQNQQAIANLVDLVTTSMEALKVGVLEADFNDSTWKATDLFDPPSTPNRIQWLRKTLTLSAEQAATAATLSLARPNDFHIVFLNGKEVGRAWNKNCALELPADLLRPGTNQLTVRLGSRWSPPSVMGDADDAVLLGADGARLLSLKDGWKSSGSMEPPLPELVSLTDVPSCLFNGMVHPLLKSPVKGVIWYQGEQNLGNAAAYAKLFPAMILDWRRHFKNEALPFYFVQLANLGNASELPSNDGWPLMREAQAKALALPETGMATAFDIGEALDIHPKNKQDVGRRLALQALAKTYGKALECNGPVYQRFEIRGDSLVIDFGYADGLMTTDGLPPKGFSIAGGDRVFHRANARIEVGKVVLTSDHVHAPVAVRYGFSENPIVTLRNAANLPAFPFRSDDWETITSSP